jgi:hypothetical protein
MLFQIQTPESWSVLAGRALIFVVYFVLFLFFRKGYAKSKSDGLPNKFLLGYALFFGFLMFYGAMSLVDQVLTIFTSTGGLIGRLDVSFDVLYGLPPNSELLFPQLANPLYLLGLLILMLLLAAQVYPLEMVLDWKRAPATTFLFIVAGAIVPAFFPALCLTIYMDIITGCVIGGMLLGLVLNIGINIKLAATTAGDLRKRSLSIIFASILFYIGFLLALKIAELAILNQLFGIPADYDVVLGYIVQTLAAVLYWRGLRSG